VIGTGNTMTASTCDQADYDTKISVFCGDCVDKICVAGNDDEGVEIEDGEGNSVTQNLVTMNGDDGILVRDANGVELVRNSSTNNIGWGISVNNSPDTLFDDNTVAGNGAGNVKCEPDPCP